MKAAATGSRIAAAATGSRTAAAEREAAPDGATVVTGPRRRKIGVGVIGFGWLGQAHSRSLLRIPTLFEDRVFDPQLVACSDTLPARIEQATSSFGFRRASASWEAVVEDPDVEAVFIAAPNMLHVQLVQAATQAGKAVFCEKPVGGMPRDVARAAGAARAAGVISGVGYNYRWAPLVQYARELIQSGELGDITNYRGRFFSMYGADPLGVNSWRFQLDQGGHGATSDLLSHAVDLAHMLLGPITRLTGTVETFIRERPAPADGASHYRRGRADDPRTPVTNEDYAGMLCEFAGGARGTFEVSRTMVGPESQMAFDAYGTHGAVGWNLERINELRLYRATEDRGSGYTTVLGGDRFPHHGVFVPGGGNPIGFEDLVTIEDYEFCAALAEGRPYEPGFEEALQWASVQEAVLRSAESGGWEPVLPVLDDAEHGR
jgi:predicted dehydrogenase